MRMLALDGSQLLLLSAIAGFTYVTVLWVGVAYFVVRDARQRSPSILFTLFAALLGFFPPFLGALIYLIIRPPRTLEEERAAALEEQLLTEPVTNDPVVRPCPTCGRDIDEDFVICPYCRTQFARKCSSCERTLRLGWPVCPYCAAEVGIHQLPHPRTASNQ
jgi:hypothetical protein